MKMKGTNIFVKILEDSDAEGLLRLELRNRDFFQTYTPLRDDAFYTLEGQRERIRKNNKMKDLDQYYLFGIYLAETGELIGNITLSEVLRGPLQSCFIGYYLDKNHNGKGYMTEAVRLAVSYAFNELKLHRIEAGVMPHNTRSMRVLEKAGFHKEGIAKKNVKINGRWEDHQVLAIINETDEHESNIK
ncbi:GNAT family N-acetyltransferase [Paenactinomyces guangxiensis]|uniref:GNAT family N-acetyltransferase n=1 Tax=Paenactinomyces guangxiensis TaxID=1490290 RepID=A0A7W2A8Z8_9BACL|nr:GNAT family protein [Paenactinomyces guangxiensis]MBA4496111.1 GNAT family N-acetyltransferase [Paenactinomyces guangxiensis]MBH8593199.1 GNAT family N-acetyltransferase [Paenactinomyces guangxiensis]